MHFYSDLIRTRAFGSPGTVDGNVNDSMHYNESDNHNLHVFFKSCPILESRWVSVHTYNPLLYAIATYVHNKCICQIPFLETTPVNAVSFVLQ